MIETVSREELHEAAHAAAAFALGAEVLSATVIADATRNGCVVYTDDGLDTSSKCIIALAGFIGVRMFFDVDDDDPLNETDFALAQKAVAAVPSWERHRYLHGYKQMTGDLLRRLEGRAGFGPGHVSALGEQLRAVGFMDGSEVHTFLGRRGLRPEA